MTRLQKLEQEIRELAPGELLTRDKHFEFIDQIESIILKDPAVCP
jgi:hypothetical protein